jgi:hypothetical protein
MGRAQRHRNISRESCEGIVFERLAPVLPDEIERRTVVGGQKSHPTRWEPAFTDNATSIQPSRSDELFALMPTPLQSRKGDLLKFDEEFQFFSGNEFAHTEFLD